MNEMKTENETSQGRLGARSLLKKIFAESNARLEEMEDGRLGFHYGYGDGKSEFFLVEADDEHVNIRIIDYCWHEVSKWDIDEVARIQSQINVCNTYSRSKVVYQFTDDDKMRLTTLMMCPLYPEIPDVENYLTAQLAEMVNTHDFILQTQTDDDASSTEESNSENEQKATKEEGGEA